MNYNLQNVQKQVDTFESMKFIDEDGKEKISGREFSKALGYKQFRNFDKAVIRTNDQIKASGGADSDHIAKVSKMIQIGKGGQREITDYHLTREQAIRVANNADTSKPQVAMVQEWLYDTSEIGQKAINIYNKLNDREYIKTRALLSDNNSIFAGTCLDHGVQQNELGLIHNACDKALYGVSTKEIKDMYGKSNRPKADFLGTAMCSAEIFAKEMSSGAIRNSNADGFEECRDISTEVHEDVRNYVIRKTGKAPLDLITGEDVKLVEKRYLKKTKEQLKGIQTEF